MSGLDTTLGSRWWAKALGLLLVPVLIAAVLLSATWNTNSRLQRVEAAIVNLDKAVTINGQTVPLGRQLSAQLIDADTNQNFTWVLADATHATDGLKSGRYAAVVTIPENFSKAATSYAGTAADAEQATIDVATSPVAGIADTALGQSVAQAAALALNQTLTQGYLDKVYVGFNDTGKQFQTVADAATKLSDGTTQLSDGLAQAAPGAKQLADGLVQITLNGGQLRTGGAGLVSGLQQYTSGASQSADGAAQLSGGLTQLSAGSADLRGSAAKLDAGIGQYIGAGTAAGLKPYTDGVTSILVKVPGQADTLSGIRQSTDSILGGNTVATYTSNATGVVTTVSNQATAVSAASTAISSGMASGVSSSIATGTGSLPCPQSIQDQGACAIYFMGVGDATTKAQAAATATITTDTASVKSQLDGIASNLGTAAPKLQTVVSDSSSLLTKANLSPSVAEMQQQKGLAQALTPGGAGLVAGLTQMRAGITIAQAQAQGAPITKTLEYGLNAYTGGVDQSAPGAAKLSAGLAQLADGGAPLVSGAQQYVSGVDQVLGGIDQAAPGATQLADGLQQSADGSKQLADGSKQLADGLAKGATQVPSYTTEDRTQLSKVVASPISVSNLDELVQPGAALAALLMILALWAGAFATYTVLPAVRKRLALSSSPTAALVVEALRPGLLIVLVQALLVSAIGQAFVRLPAYRWLSLTVVLMLAGVAFVAVNHALTAWAKGAGRVVGIAAAVVTGATAVTSAVPGWLDAIRPLSPLSPAYDAVRAVVSGGPGVTTPVFLLIGWTLLGAIFTVAAILRARTVSPAALAPVV